MRVTFIGSSRFGLRCLERVGHLSGIEIVGIITNEQRFTISYAPAGVNNVLHGDFKGYAKTNNIPCYTMHSKMTESDLMTHLKIWKPELLLVAGWYHILPRSIRKLAPAVGLHASLLPDYSGGAPLVWAMINGEKRTGVTLFRFDDGADSGPIIGQASIDILLEDTIATLYKKIEALGIGLLEKNMPGIIEGSAVSIPQDESKRRVFPQRKPEDGRIDWNWTSQKVHDFVPHYLIKFSSKLIEF